MGLWYVVPDSERKQWTLEPFASVGPLRFGMSPGEASAALGGVKPALHWHDPHFDTMGLRPTRRDALLRLRQWLARRFS